jgi:hypothetical protein
MSAMRSDVQEFHQFLGECLQQGQSFACAEAAVEAWRDLHPVEDDATADLQAALQQLASGDPGLTLEEFDRQFRSRHGVN